MAYTAGMKLLLEILIAIVLHPVACPSTQPVLSKVEALRATGRVATTESL